jgi:hypothetical protein
VVEVMAGIASIPERETSLRRVLEQLSPQVDHIALSLNDYRRVPSFVAAFPNVDATLRPANQGDAEKFAGVDNWTGVVATADDDVFYPRDYIRTVLAGLERYDFRRAASFHGGTTLGWNGSAVAASHKRIRCLGNLDRDDTDVNVLGTGTLAWHTEHVPVWRDLFRRPNMADVQFACHAHLMGIPMVALAHRSGWLRDICPPAGRRIYEANRDRDGSPQDTALARETEIRRFDWTEKLDRPKVRVAISTCQRPDQLVELLHDLELEAQWVDLEVEVYEDAHGGRHDYTEAKRICRTHDWEWSRFQVKLGRYGYWRSVKRQMQDCRFSRAEYFIFLPDDVRLVRHAIPRAIEIWHRLEEPATLTLWRLRSLDGRANWTGRRPEQRAYATESFHVDGNFLCQRPTLEALDYTLTDPRKKNRPSSGVGSQMSKRLHAQRRRMYRVDKSLTINNDGGVSIMNPEARARHPAVCL